MRVKLHMINKEWVEVEPEQGTFEEFIFTFYKKTDVTIFGDKVAIHKDNVAFIEKV